MPVTYRLATVGKRLWTRDKALAPRAEVESLLETVPLGDIVFVDLKGVEVFDFSFAAEFFGRLLQRVPAEHPGKFLVVENLGPWTGPNLEATLTGLELAAIVRNERGLYRLLGKVSETDRMTFDVLLSNGGRSTAIELATGLGVNLTAVNERLAKLMKAGVIRREDAPGRARFTYFTPS